MKSEQAPSVRASISFPPEMYEALEEFAKKKKVSLAWGCAGRSRTIRSRTARTIRAAMRIEGRTLTEHCI